MKKGIAVLLILLFTACKGQEKDQTDKKIREDMETAEMPKGQWEVQKEYDEFGNLIKYDSIYSYSYSNIKGDSLQVNLDSIMHSFRGYLKDRDPFSDLDRFSYFPHPDSLFMNEFFSNDYFFRNWERQQSEMEDMMKRMDSMRNAFMKQRHPGLMESKNN
ncbi:MAG: hypothetical protein WBN18_09800 [Flavobacteriaceae bacterium]